MEKIEEDIVKKGTSFRYKPLTPRIETNWQVGNKVEHTKFGMGVIVKLQGEGEDEELYIAFPAPIGMKKLLAKYAPIEKV